MLIIVVVAYLLNPESQTADWVPLQEFLGQQELQSQKTGALVG